MNILQHLLRLGAQEAEWVNPEAGALFHRCSEKPFKNGTRLTVRELQTAAAINEEGIAGLFSTGRYILNTDSLKAANAARTSDLKFPDNGLEIVFIHLKALKGIEWHTSAAWAVEDGRFGRIPLPASGEFSIQVYDAGRFVSEIMNHSRIFETEMIVGQMKSWIFQALSDSLSASGAPVQKAALQIESLREQIRGSLSSKAERWGIRLIDFSMEISDIPDEVLNEITALENPKAVIKA